jgi:hypothetical protein
LITLKTVTNSTITLNDVTYGSNGTGANGRKYNFTNVSSTVNWVNVNYSGTLTGDANERNDGNNSIHWGASTFYWVSPSASNWNNAANWDVASGGTAERASPVREQQSFLTVPSAAIARSMWM